MKVFVFLQKAASSAGQGRPVVRLLNEGAANERLSEAVRWGDVDRIRDGFWPAHPKK